MNPIVIAHASRDGQAAKIASALAAHWREVGYACELIDMKNPCDIGGAQLFVWVCAVRYGKHLPEGIDFINSNRYTLQDVPYALVSVNLTARKSGKQDAAGNVYLRKLISRERLQPAAAIALGGRLDYARYRWFDRCMIRLIMRMTGGPTRPDTCIEYTDWQALATFANRLLPARHHNLPA